MTAQNRLTDEESKKIADCFSDHPLMMACQRAFLRYQDMTYPLSFAPEEIFVESATVIDELLRHPKDEHLQDYMVKLWHELRIKIGSWERGLKAEILDMAVSSVFLTVSFAMSRHWATFYSFDVYRWLMKTMAAKMDAECQEIMTVFYDLLGDCEGVEQSINNWNKEGICQSIESVLRGDSIFVSAVSIPGISKAVIEKLHSLMEGKEQPKDIAMPIRAAMDVGVIRKPTLKEFHSEFREKRIKAPSSYHDYTNIRNHPYEGEEYVLMKREFEKLKG
ncbi:MAG: hypothetical protein K6D91_00740 [Prevotella sp.]|nr:hypothetical protein [Prevotella sp.]